MSSSSVSHDETDRCRWGKQVEIVLKDGKKEGDYDRVCNGGAARWGTALVSMTF